MALEATKLTQQEVTQFNATIAANASSDAIKQAANKATSAGIALTPPHLSEFIGSEADLVAAYRDWSHSWEVSAENSKLYGQSSSTTEPSGMFRGSYKVSELYFIRPSDGKSPAEKLVLATGREEGGEVRFFDGDPLANFTLRNAHAPDGNKNTWETTYASAQEQKAADAKAKVDDTLQPSLERKERKLAHLKESLAKFEQGLTTKQGPKKISIYEELDGLRKVAIGTDKKSRAEWARYQKLVKFVYDAEAARTDAALDRQPTGDLENIKSAEMDMLNSFLQGHPRINAYDKALRTAELPSYMPGNENSGERAPIISDDQFMNYYSYERFPTSVAGANEAKRVLSEQIAKLQPEVDRLRADITEQKKLYPDVNVMLGVIASSDILGIARYANSIADHSNSVVAKAVATEALILHGAELLKQPAGQRDSNRLFMVSLAIGRLIISDDDPDKDVKRTILSNLLTQEVGGDTGHVFFNEPPISDAERPKERVEQLLRMIGIVIEADKQMKADKKGPDTAPIQP